MTHVEKIYCLGCGAALPIRANITRVKCEYCGTVNFTDIDHRQKDSDSICPNCDFVNARTAQYCGNCGKPLYHTCPRCNTQNRIEVIYCTNCGTDIEKAGIAQAKAESPKAGNTGTIEIFRKPALTGFTYKVNIKIDGKQMGALRGNESLTLSVPPGNHVLQVEGGGLSRNVNVKIASNQHLKFQTTFSEWGILGGGLSLDLV